MAGSPRRLTDADLRILRVLQREGRLTNAELAERVGLSPSPCLRRLKQLESEGVIEGYAALLDRGKLGLGIEAFVRVNVERHRDADTEAFEREVRRLPEIVGVWMMAGDMDFLLHVVVTDLEAYGRFTRDRLIRLPGVKDLHTSFVIDAVKSRGELPLGLE
ncbi:transcriptional regulator, AsnC family [Tistlia consotensis]|uniref:Transcriptional regulator, AsnC family n=1 Tax=Tistlia consotensis USBA 355 TaxID=560819 RepID=A0A1Y6B7E3_9PROT|nr:Lrp/AsnC family transcriptional regulator [Tistlia consotensis]SME89028.1 transcriptional regulator, AsnC family [Tistlia consotensis USBA 355]SNR25592.1 transcriptional regulator, AsnC family [Tistlia consotensis]